MSKLLDDARRFLGGRRGFYRDTFRGQPGQHVLRDLARFCRANVSTFHENERVQAKLDGRREVWLRIQQHLQLSEEQLWQLLDGRSVDI